MGGLSPRLAPVPALALFALGLIAFRTVALQAPAFREELQAEAITGQSRLRDLSEMYDAGSYLFQIGYGYLNADALFTFSGVEAPGELASFETAAARFARAEELFAASLRRDPANAHAWLAYAQTLAARGAFEAARGALVTSWELAPTTPRLATGRLFLIETLRDLTGEDGALGEIRASDLAVLRRHAPERAASFGDS